MQQTSFRNRLHLKGWHLWMVTAVLLYTLVGFFLLPWIIERQLLAFADQRLQRPMSIERVRVNPYSLTLTIEGMKLDEADGTALAALREFHINFEASSLVRRAWTFKELRFADPYLNFLRYSEGDNNLRRLARTLDETGEAEAAEPADEGGLPDKLKDQIVDASTGDMRISPYWTGKTVRAVNNAVAQAWAESGLPALPTPHQRVLMEDFKEAAMAAGRFEITMNAGGQGAGMITKRRPAADIFADLLAGTRETLDRMKRI